MPYDRLSSLPADVQRLPKRGQLVWRAAWRTAHETNHEPEGSAAAIAWSAAERAGFKAACDGHVFPEGATRCQKCGMAKAITTADGLVGHPTDHVTHRPAQSEDAFSPIAGPKPVPVLETPIKSLWAVKFVDEERGTIRGLLAPYGGPPELGDRDLTGEWFDSATDFGDSLFGGVALPVLFHHGQDKAIDADVIGRFTKTEDDAQGRWLEAQLDKAHAYYQQVAELIRRGGAGLSSGAVSHLVQRTKEGYIKRWPIVEGSITPTPANPLAVIEGIKAIELLGRSGISQELTALLAPQEDGMGMETDAIKSAIADFNRSGGKAGAAEGNRLAAEATKTLGGEHRYIDGGIVRVQAPARVVTANGGGTAATVRIAPPAPTTLRDATKASPGAKAATEQKPPPAPVEGKPGQPPEAPAAAPEKPSNEATPPGAGSNATRAAAKDSHTEEGYTPSETPGKKPAETAEESKAKKAIRGSYMSAADRIKAMAERWKAMPQEDALQTLQDVHDLIANAFPEVCAMEEEEPAPEGAGGQPEGTEAEPKKDTVVNVVHAPRIPTDEHEQPDAGREAGADSKSRAAAKSADPGASIKGLIADMEARLEANATKRALALEERMEAIERTPAANGPVRRTSETKSRRETETESPEEAEIKSLERVIAGTTNPTVKRVLGQDLATLQLKRAGLK